ncbi:MAG: bifunctional hydroxymethylpyrimidine kinase/phosphomethylpyrimidine kinase [Clostridiales bacterium]|nr:bifunctional hydroxymethylpyrimidine kinase/phosphomethylpyrimidine kinase [Clostridiales bacterium]
MRGGKRVLSLQDLSCVGQCSLTAALPVLSACGVECCVLPTAVLSTHTGPEFAPPVVHSLADVLPAVWESWMDQGFTFDALALGYLGTGATDFAACAVDDLRGSALILVDPAMGDTGRFYSGFGPDHAARMAALCARADVILPNLTEGCLLLGEPVPERYEEDFCLRLARRLGDLGPKAVVLTGLDCVPGQVTNLIYRTGEGSAAFQSRPRLPGRFHGTGDLFAAALLGRLMGGASLEQAAETAGDFVAAAIHRTGPEHPYGVRFEGCLGMLTDRER